MEVQSSAMLHLCDLESGTRSEEAERSMLHKPCGVTCKVDRFLARIKRKGKISQRLLVWLLQIRSRKKLQVSKFKAALEVTLQSHWPKNAGLIIVGNRSGSHPSDCPVRGRFFIPGSLRCNLLPTGFTWAGKVSYRKHKLPFGFSGELLFRTFDRANLNTSTLNPSSLTPSSLNLSNLNTSNLKPSNLNPSNLNPSNL